jgi:DNA repair exonuclease SbcCD ATPase subunit
MFMKQQGNLMYQLSEVCIRRNYGSCLESLKSKIEKFSDKMTPSSASTAATNSPVIVSVLAPAPHSPSGMVISRCKKCVCGAAPHLHRERVRLEELEKALMTDRQELLAQISRIDARKMEPIGSLVQAWNQLDVKFAEIKKLEKLINSNILNEIQQKNEKIQNELNRFPHQSERIAHVIDEVNRMNARETELDQLISTIEETRQSLEKLYTEKNQLVLDLQEARESNKRNQEEFLEVQKSIGIEENELNEIQKLKIKLSEKVLIKSSKLQNLKNYENCLNNRESEIRKTRDALSRKEDELRRREDDEEQIEKQI